MRKAGAEPLSVGETGYRQISNSKRPLLKPDDLKGIKVRVVGSPMYGEIMTGMGANPTFMSWADAQPALASGAVDAQENPLEVFLAAKINTLGQKYVTKWNYSNDILLFAIAAPVWATWTPADQKIVREAARTPPSSRSRWCASSSPRTWSACARSAWTCTCRRPAEAEAVAHRLPPRLCALEGADPRRAGQQDRAGGRAGRARPEPAAQARALPIDSSLFFKLVRVVNLTARPFVETRRRARTSCR